MEMGNKIRDARKRRGLNMKELADRVGVSYLTIHRIETDKVSPSVALLSEIAHHLREPLANFFNDRISLTLVRAGTAPKVRSSEMDLELLIPKGVINESTSVTYGRIEAGRFVSIHSHRGFELTYNLKGGVIFRHGNREYKLKEGDLLYFDASIEHSMTVLEDHEFLAIYFREGT